VRFPDDPELPDPMRGQTLLELLHVYVGDEGDGQDLLSPLQRLATPVFHEPGRTREDTLPPMVVSDGGVYLDAIDDRAVDAILELAGPGKDVPLASVGLQLLGGALSTPQGSPNAVTGRGASYAFHVIGAEPDLIDTEIPARIRALHSAVGDWHSSGTIPNYIGPSNAPGALDRAWVPDVRARLDAVRAKYDPIGILANSHTN
jgi:hypothetical protein